MEYIGNNKVHRWTARYDKHNTHSIKIWLGGLAHGEVLPPEARQACMETSRVCGVILPNPGGHSNEVMKHSKIAHSSFCARCLPLPRRWYLHLGNVQAATPVGNFSYQAGKPATLSVWWKALSNWKTNLVFENQKCQQFMLTFVVDVYWLICSDAFSHTLPQDALLTQIL